MNFLTNITDAPRQKMTVVLDDGSKLDLVLEFKAQQTGWFFTSIQYGDFLVQGMRVCTNPNCLHQFKNLIPFGIGVFVQDNQEPLLVTDFLSGRAQMAILSAAEVAEWDQVLSGKVRS